MKYFVLNVVHGLGPVLRLLEVGEELNRELIGRGAESYRFIIPDLGEKQNFVVEDEFGRTGFTQYVLVDPLYGEKLRRVVYRGDDHRNFLRNLVGVHPDNQHDISAHFESEFVVYPLGDKRKEMKVDQRSCYELARNPLIRLPFTGFMYTFGYRSDILREMQRLGIEGYDEGLLGQLLPILDGVEQSREINFVQDPPTIIPSRTVIYTPLHSRRKPLNGKQIGPGIYVSVTGIEGLREQLIRHAGELGLKLYCGKSVASEFPDAIVESPDIVTNPNIYGVFSRFGWGAIILALMAKKPLITPPATVTDDPEISLNQRLFVDKLQLASSLDGRPIGEVLEEARYRARNIPPFLLGLEEKYGTIEGPVYASKILVEHLLKN